MLRSDIVVEAFADELAALEKAAGIGGLMAAGLAGMAALPIAKTVAVGKMRSGQQDFGDMSRPQFQRRFGQHLPPATATELLAMGGKSLFDVGNRAAGRLGVAGIGAAKGLAATNPLETALDMWSKGPGYVRDNLRS